MRSFFRNRANWIVIFLGIGAFISSTVFFLLSIFTASVDEGTGEVSFYPPWIAAFSISALLFGAMLLVFFILLLIHLIGRRKKKQG